MWILACWLLACVPAWAAPSILIFGDSLSAGYGLNTDEAWPHLLQQRIKAAGKDYNVVNLSISGETTAGGRTRLPAALRKEKPVILVLALGANDGLRGLPVSAMQENLRAMITMARQQKIAVLLIGMRLPPNYGPYAQQFERSFIELAEQERLAFHPFLLRAIAQRPEMFQNDQLHPLRAAQPLLLDDLWPALSPLLK